MKHKSLDAGEIHLNVWLIVNYFQKERTEEVAEKKAALDKNSLRQQFLACRTLLFCL